MPSTVAGPLQILPVLAGPALLALVIARRRLVKRLVAAGATDEASAVDLGRLRPLARLWKARLLKSGVLTATADGHVWLDQPAWWRYRRVRRRRAAIVLVPAILALVYWVSRAG